MATSIGRPVVIVTAVCAVVAWIGAAGSAQSPVPAPASLGPRPEYKLEGTPLMVNGVIYTTAGTRRAVVALDAATGELRWMHAEHEGARAAASPRQLSGRGVAYWSDGREERILYITTGYRLVALDAHTGARIAAFGKDGIVDLKEGVVFGKGQQIDLVTGEIGVHSTRAITKEGVSMIGSAC